MIMKPKYLIGRKLTEGIVLGHVCLYKEDILEAAPKRRIKADGVEEEKARFLNAVESTKEELSLAYSSVAVSLSSVEAEVFNAHLMILEDYTFIDKINTGISKGLVNSETALLSVLEEYAAKFKLLANEYFRERMNDINDIARRILKNLDVKHTGFMCGCPEGKPVIVAAEDLTSSLISGLGNKKVGGIIIEKGSMVTHGAVLARALGVPVIIGISELISNISCAEELLVDADKGIVYINPSNEVIESYREEISKVVVKEKKYDHGYVKSSDGVSIKLMANASNIKDIDNARELGVTDIGLFRTEFIFIGRASEPGLDEQVNIYKRIMEAAEGVVTFRLLDIGGDKILDFLTMPEQENPGLGLRGVRIYDKYPDIIGNQIQALLIAKGTRSIRIMIPMVSTVDEFVKTRSRIMNILNDIKNNHQINGDNISIGCMIEIPSAVYLIKYFIEEADFLSIGTNDLIQYIMGVDRANHSLLELSDPFQPAVIRVLKEIADSTKGIEKELTVCGEVAGDPEMAKILVGLGFRNLSINPYSIDKVGNAIGKHKLTELETEVAEILKARTLEEMMKIINIRQG